MKANKIDSLDLQDWIKKEKQKEGTITNYKYSVTIEAEYSSTDVGQIDEVQIDDLGLQRIKLVMELLLRDS